MFVLVFVSEYIPELAITSIRLNFLLLLYLVLFLLYLVLAGLCFYL